MLAKECESERGKGLTLLVAKLVSSSVNVVDYSGTTMQGLVSQLIELGSKTLDSRLGLRRSSHTDSLTETQPARYRC